MSEHIQHRENKENSEHNLETKAAPAAEVVNWTFKERPLPERGRQRPADSNPEPGALHYPSGTNKSGSFYHKVVSPFGHYKGIEGVVTLGYPHIDGERNNVGKALDSFKTYLGGRAKLEIDAGLGWEITTDKEGNKDYVHKAWRPFWRNNKWHNAPSEARYYWHSGETVKISLQVVAPHTLRLTISDLGDHPRRQFSTQLHAPGFDTGNQLFFKRVDSIDQVGTEGKTVQISQSYIDNINWKNTVLISATGQKQPLAVGWRKVTDEPVGHITVKSDARQRKSGGETVSIEAANKS